MRNNQTASFYPNLTDMLKAIINDIAENILKEGQPIVIVGDYSWYREVLSLFAKQVNLCDSCILLLEIQITKKLKNTFINPISLRLGIAAVLRKC